MSNWFGKLQNIGKALMLPIAVLPAAALLLRLGAPDVFDIPFITKAGGAIFDNLALIFAIGIGVGLAKDNNGTAGLAGAIGYLILTTALKTIDETLNMSVLAGIVSGIEAGILYNRYHTVKLPEYLGFFGGRRFVLIMTAAVSILLAAVFGVIWSPCQAVIHAVGEWIIEAGALGTFIYGVLNRLLIPVGLHHILNSFILFVFGE
ncbi:MAG: PTS transporter subunit EIIC, partial [Selenomonadaceae bacterium]|nr:PTS transporter subunit EIIC [Selenomonadaceae bacterium]